MTKIWKGEKKRFIQQNKQLFSAAWHVALFETNAKLQPLMLSVDDRLFD